MLKRTVVVVAAAVALAGSLPLAAQSSSFEEREDALARQLAEQQEALDREREAQEREFAQQQAVQQQRREQERQFEAEYQAQQREFAAQQREQERAYVAQQREQERVYEAQQRDYVVQQRQQQQQQQQRQQRESAEVAHELAKAKSQLAASAAEIARLSAQLSSNALTRVRVFGQRAVLGINIEDANDGVRVAGVSPNGPAAAAGVMVGDVIVAIDGFELRSAAEARDDSPTAAMLGQLDDIEAGQDVELRILRGGNQRNLVVKASENNSLPFRFEPDRFIVGPNSWINEPGTFVRMFTGQWNDVELVSLTPALGEYFGVDQGLLAVRAGSMGELGLRDGDVILEIGGRQPQTPEHAMRILASFEPGESIPMSIMRQRRREAVSIRVPEASRGWRSVEPREPAEPRAPGAPRASLAPPAPAPAAPGTPVAPGAGVPSRAPVVVQQLF